MAEYRRRLQRRAGFCHSTPIEKIRELDYVLSPGRYVGLPEEEDDFDFGERFTELKQTFETQLEEEGKLNKRILKTWKGKMGGRDMTGISYEKPEKSLDELKEQYESYSTLDGQAMVREK